jgi:hypothetical protein
MDSDFNDRRAAIISVVSDHEGSPSEGGVSYYRNLLIDGARDAPPEVVQIARETYPDEFEQINWIRRNYPRSSIAVERLSFEAPAPFRGKQVHVTGVVATFPTVAACSHYKLTFHV